MKPEDQNWNAVRSGNMEAFSEMYKSYYQFLFVNGLCICGSKEITKDCIHEMFLEIWNSHEQLPAVQHVGFYLKTYLKRKILREVPKEQHSYQVSEEIENINIQHSYEELLIETQSSDELKEKLRRAILKLSKKELEIIRMKFFENKSYEEIAEITTTAPRTVYNQVYDALKRLRKSLRFFSLI